MQYKKIGSTKVPVIGQGTGKIYDEHIIRVGIDYGLTFIDTAESYGNEGIVGRAIKGRRDKVFISTKFSPEHNAYHDVIKSCEASLKRLGTDYIDLYSSYYPNPNIDAESTANALLELVAQQKIRYIGVSNSAFPRVNHLEASAIQLEYNLFDRSPERRLIPYCRENGVLFIAYSPLQDFHSLNPEGMIWIQEIAYRHNKTLAQVILNWIVSHKPVITIPRSNDIRHIKENVQAADFELTREEIRAISKLFPYKVKYLDPEKIDISLDAGKYPQTKEQAMNWKKWAVKPQDMNNENMKPVRVVPTNPEYQLQEGIIRYWAWAIQNPNQPVPVLIKNTWHIH